MFVYNLSNGVFKTPVRNPNSDLSAYQLLSRVY